MVTTSSPRAMGAASASGTYDFTPYRATTTGLPELSPPHFTTAVTSSPCEAVGTRGMRQYIFQDVSTVGVMGAFTLELPTASVSLHHEESAVTHGHHKPASVLTHLQLEQNIAP